MAFDVVITKVAENDFDEAISHIAVAASELADD